MVLRSGISKSSSLSSRRAGRQKSRSYEDIMKTLLLQNQQIIIQQQNMMFMVMKQLNPGASNLMLQQQHQQQQQLHMLEETLGQPNSQQQPQPQHHHHHQPQQHQQPTQQQQTQQPHPALNQQQQQPQQQQQQHLNSHLSNSNSHHNNQHQLSHHGQSTATSNHIQEDLDAYLTPATSEQEPLETMVPNMTVGPDSCALSTLLGGDGLMTNNLLYNPSTDFGSITPYKNNNGHQQHPMSNGSSTNNQHHHQPQQHETPSYYSSGCESLTTPRVEQQRQPTTANISQNVVKNLNDAFKSPSKPKISVQILSGSATREMKNNKAKIIQSMNISEFLRQVHNDDSSSKSSTQ